MHLQLVDYVIWAADFLALLAIVGAMHKRRLRGPYPYFFLYILLQVALNPLLLLFSTISYRLYYYAYYSVLIVSVVASVAVFWDILRNTLAASPGLRDLVALMFWSSVALVLAAMVLLNVSRGQGTNILADWTLSAVSATRVAQCALILLLFCFRKYLGISLDGMVFGIALGFGLFAATNMLIAGVAHVAGSSQAILSQVNSSTYLASSLIWLIYAMRGSAQLQTAGRAECFA